METALTDLIQKRQTIHRQLRENEDRISHLEKQLQATQKLATLGTMSCLVAHEFNNLLQSIINYANLALQSQNDISLMHKALEKTVKNGNHAATIIRNMLGVAGSQSEEPHNISLKQLVEECFQCLGRDPAKDRISVNINIPNELRITTIAGQLQQVLLNLIINARQAMLKRGGTLTITAQHINQITEINVSDTGCGISPELVDRIFEPFFSTKTEADTPDRQGCGLGLSVCKNIVESQGGTISVASQPNKGTTFSISLPTKD